jgi:hypothetical protein
MQFAMASRLACWQQPFSKLQNITIKHKKGPAPKAPQKVIPKSQYAGAKSQSTQSIGHRLYSILYLSASICPRLAKPLPLPLPA